MSNRSHNWGPAGRQLTHLAASAATVWLLLLLCRAPVPASSLSAASLEQARVQQSPRQTASDSEVNASISSTTTISSPNQHPLVQQNKQHQASNCTQITIPCSTAEFSSIIKRLNQSGDLLSSYQPAATTTTNSSNVQDSSNNSSSRQQVGAESRPMRPECVRELVGLIRNLASDELEMKSLLEFASGTGPLEASSLFRAASERQPQSAGGANCSRTDQTAKQQEAPATSVRANQHDYLLADQETAPAERSKVLPKVVGRVNYYIDSLERFTLTREWASMLKVFQGVESILALFVPKGNSTASSPAPARLIAGNATNSVARVNATELVGNKTTGAAKSGVAKTTLDDTETVLVELRQSLPGEVQTLTNSLGNLFPWHVWPWNNADLYATIETFLNHGIFAFSKTTSGPERRIDYLSDMLQTLFKSLTFDTFPKKCNDWSKVICDPERFHDRLVLGPQADDSSSEGAAREREQKVKLLLAQPRNQLTGELTCIMFSSLSMQQFGASAKDLQGQDEAAAWASVAASRSINQQRLTWDRLVHKGLKLYGLAREALSDEQWAALYKLMNDLWTRRKISDRVIMVGRIVQLLTNCHMPREMLESALWKDIYKYKNALNQLSDIVIEELNRSSENGKFTLAQLALGSRNLHEILVRFMRILPRSLESLSRTVVDQLPDLVNRFFTDKVSFFQTPCKGSSLADLIPQLESQRQEILELEELICAQLNTKPSFSMMQINNLTNELLAMAFNFSNFGQAFAIPAGLLSSLQNPVAPPTRPPPGSGEGGEQRENVTSIVDELVANPRLQAIVAILQSSPLDPPEVHAELPELDWVEAGTSVALLYESIQRLLSFDGQFVVFPEVENFQDQLMANLEKSRQLFKKFSKRDPIRLFAYALDALMPVAIRTFKPMDSFYAECQTTLRDLFNQVPDGAHLSGAANPDEPQNSGAQRESRQWQCAISSLHFGAHALDKLIATFNSMLDSVLAQASALQQHQLANATRNATNGCLLLDGSLAKLLDNWPQVMELALESVLVASTSSSDQQVGLYDTICNGNYSLDPFSGQMNHEEVQRTRAAMCRLASKSSLADCAEVLKLDEWKSAMQQLNGTWFETNAISVEPAFRATTLRVHEFLVLFGRVKPSSWSDSLLARTLNVNSFWDSLLNKTVSTVERYQERRLELGLQTLEPIVYDNLLASSSCRPITTISAATESPSANASALALAPQETCDSIRKVLITSIASAHAIIKQLNATAPDKFPANSSGAKLATLFDLADKFSLPAAETLLRTLATNSAKLEALLQASASQIAEPTTMLQVFDRFCPAPIDRYLEFEPSNETLSLAASTRAQMLQFQLEFCKFNWTQFQEQLSGQVNSRLANYPVRQLTRVALTKWGQALDLVLALSSGDNRRLPSFLRVQHWQPFHAQLSLITPLKEQPSNLIWIWRGIERLLGAAENNRNQLTDAMARSLDQLNCALDSVKGGLSWENLANIYSDRQDILAAHSTINNGFVLASIGVSTFMAPKKFQRLLDEFVRPIRGSSGANSTGAAAGQTAGFCEMRERARWENILSLPNEAVDFGAAIESFQELVCDTNFDTLPQSINPISVCYQTAGPTTPSSAARPPPAQLAETLDRSFKLASLAAMDAKLVAANDARPPIFDKSQWSSFWDWWSTQPAAEPRGGLALALVRAFQTLDSLNFGHVVWRALFKSVHELSELLAYLVRAAEQRQVALAGNASARLEAPAEEAPASKRIQPQQVVSTLSSLMFPEASNLIPLKTFKQLRYIKSIADYFSATPDAQATICRQHSARNDTATPTTQAEAQVSSKVELIGFKLSSSAKLNTLLCHYHSSQWLTALNIVISARTSALTKRVNYMTKYLALFTRQYKDYERLESFIHARQMDNIETVANATVSHLLAASYSLRGSLSFAKLSNISWASMPNVLESIDKQLCDNSGAEFGIHNLQQLVSFRSFASLELKKPDLETLICQLPQWNVSQIYEYLSESFDLQKMISLVTVGSQLQQQQQQQSQALTTTNATASRIDFITSKLFKANNSNSNNSKQCTTPFKLAAKWLQFIQETIVQVKSKASQEKIRKCLSLQTKNQSICAQSLRYIRVFNKLLTSINDFTEKNSWLRVRKTWNSISYHLMSQTSGQQPAAAPVITK